MTPEDEAAIDAALKRHYELMHAPAPVEAPVEPKRCGIRPHPLLSLKVHPKQVAQATERAKRHGVPTEYKPNGMPIVTSRAHQKALIKMENKCGQTFFNQDGSYGD